MMENFNMSWNMTDFHSNSTTDNDNKSKGFLGMIILMFVLAVALNLSALLMLVKSSKSHRWSPFYRLLLSLNITDFLGSLTCFPVLLATYANNVEWPGGQALCNYLGFMISFVFMSSAGLVGSMSLERFLGVWFPFKYNDSDTKAKRANFVLGSIWIFTGVLALMPIIGFGDYVLQFPGTWCFYNFRSTILLSKTYAYLYSALWLLIVFGTVSFNILVVAKLIYRRCYVKRFSNNPGGIQTKSKKTATNEIFSIVLLLIIVVTTTTCGVPLAIRAIVNESGLEKDNEADLHASRMATFNMILDPLVYILFRRESLQKCIMCFKRFSKRNNPSRNTTSTSNTDNSDSKTKGGSKLTIEEQT